MTEILLYTTSNQDIKLEVLIQDETIWLNQKQISELFDVKVPAIYKHLKNIFVSGELDEKVVVSKMEITTKHGAIAGKQQTIARVLTLVDKEIDLLKNEPEALKRAEASFGVLSVEGSFCKKAMANMRNAL